MKSNKKKYNLFFFLPAAYCLLFTVFCLISTGCYAQGTGSINFNQTPKQQPEDASTWDFGVVREGAVVKHEFVLKNETEKVLNIKDVATSCGCTVSEVKKKTLAPQEETTVETQLKTKGYSGNIKQFVYVNTDNMEDPVIRFVIKADVVK